MARTGGMTLPSLWPNGILLRIARAIQLDHPGVNGVCVIFLARPA